MQLSGFDIFENFDMFDFIINNNSPFFIEYVPTDIDLYLSAQDSEDRVIKGIKETKKLYSSIEILRNDLKSIGFSDRKKLKATYLEYIKNYIKKHNVYTKQETNLDETYKYTNKYERNHNEFYEEIIDNINPTEEAESLFLEMETEFAIDSNNIIGRRKRFEHINKHSLSILEHSALEYVLNNMTKSDEKLNMFTKNGKRMLANRAYIKLKLETLQ